MLVSTAAAHKDEDRSARLVPAGMAGPFFLVTALFFLWGVPNNLNDVLIRQFMKSFTITRFQAGLVQSAFYLGYFLLATPAALLMRRFGYKFGFLAGLSLFSGGCFLFWPAALVGRYSLFLAALFVIAMGLSFLETASNPFIAQLGGEAGAARRLNLAQAFNPLGAITGVLIGTVFIFSGVELTHAQVAAMQAAHTYEAYLRHETTRVVMPYLVIGGVALAWLVVIALTRFPALASESYRVDGAVGDSQGHFAGLLRRPNFLFAVVAQFVYVGAQVGTWSYFIQYVQDATHQPEKVAGYFLTGTLAAFGVGRFASAAIMRRVQPGKLMGVYAICNVVLVAVGILMPGWVGLWALFTTSFFMSVMYPTIFALGIEGLGEDTKIGGSIIVMAIVGGAVLTPVMGWISQTRGISSAYVIPLLCYAVVAIYSFVHDRFKQRTLPSHGEHAFPEGLLS